MAIGGIIKGIGRIADDLADIPEETFTRVLKESKPAQAEAPTTSPTAQVDEVAALSDEEFEEALKSFDNTLPDSTPPVAQVDEVEDMTDEEFLATLKSFKEGAPVEGSIKEVDADLIENKLHEFFTSDELVNSATLPDVSTQLKIEESFLQFQNGLITEDELKTTLARGLGIGSSSEDLTISQAKTFLADEVGMPIEDIPFDLVPEEQVKDLAEQVQAGLITNKEAFDTIAGVTAPEVVISPDLAVVPTLQAAGLTRKQIDALPASFQATLSNFFKAGPAAGPDEIVDIINQEIKKANIGGVEIQPGQIKALQVQSPENFADEKLTQVEKGLITPEEAAQEPGVADRAKDSILGNTSISEDQVSLLSDADAIKLNSQVFAPQDDISLILAQNADNVKDGLRLPLIDPNQPELRPVGATLFAVRGSRIGRQPARIRRELENEVQFADEMAFINTALREDITDINQVTDLDVIENMSDLELASLNFYTKNGDEAVNKALRRGEVRTGSALDQTIQFMNSTLDQLPSYEGVTYRQVPDINVFDLYETGEEVTESAFTSTTLKELFQPEQLGLRKVIFVVQGKSGKYIEPMTMPTFRGEHEVLFKTGTRFRVVDKDEETLQIFLEEVE